jgi:hypothetical protein
MRTTGGTICGYWSTGSSTRPMAPTRTMTMESTVEKTGRSMKKSDFMAYSSFGSGSSSRVASTGRTFMPWESLW